MSTQNNKAGIKEDFAAVKSWLGTFFATLWGDVEPAIATGIETFFSTFGQQALSLVTEQATKDGLTGQEKFDNVKGGLVAIITKAGWSAAESLVETLIQDAYTIFKAREGVSVVTNPDTAPQGS